MLHTALVTRELKPTAIEATAILSILPNFLQRQRPTLRLYVRGKQEPGSAPGHGTYYHEWQMAERHIHELEWMLRAT